MIAAERIGVDVRKIIHVDMDAFYASVEQRDLPHLRGCPVAVGGSRERGVVAAASYEARAFGVRSAMPSVTALRRCPDLIFVKPRFDVYRAVSNQIRAIFNEYTHLVEPLSLDEAYLDVTNSLNGTGSATAVAAEIRARIKRETGLTASAGISVNKFLSKMASDVNKPDGQFVITPNMAAAYIESIPVGRFHGIGSKTEQKLREMGIYTGLHLRERSIDFLKENFGRAGVHYYWISRGIDERRVEPNRVRKSVGAENTFSRDLSSLNDLEDALGPLVEKVHNHCRRSGSYGKTLTLKVKFQDFRQITRSRSHLECLRNEASLGECARLLLGGLFPLPLPVRLIGLTISSLVGSEVSPRNAPPSQLSLDV